ncbi:MAG TPA: hypothetical protein VF337_09820 [Candidatus Limnocylindrales bacterium]
MRLMGRSPRGEAAAYVVRSPYGEARAELLSRRPGSVDNVSAGPFGRLFAVVADMGLEMDLVSVYVFADGTIAIYNTGGIHSTGLRGAPKVSQAAEAILEEVEKTLGEFSPVEDIGTIPLPRRGHCQILARTLDGDFVAFDQSNPKHGPVAVLAAMALILTKLARTVLIEGLDRVEAGEVRYAVAPEYRRIRSTLMDWLPGPERLPAAARVAGVAMEFGDAATDTVTSLFAFADDSTSLYRSDGALVEGLSEVPGMAIAARALLASIEAALPEFRPAELISLPQPGRVQFMARARLGGSGEWTRLLAITSREALAGGRHPLSAAFDQANEVLRIAG